MHIGVNKERVVAYQQGVSIKSGGSRSGGERSDPERREPPVPAAGEIPDPPDPEVPEKAQRRKFSAQYKKRILQEADACRSNPGALGALLRREGVYSSNLRTWRNQREKGELDGLSPKKRGRKPVPINPLAGKLRELESENRRLQKQLDKAETIITFQKKLSEMLGISLDPQETEEQC